MENFHLLAVARIYDENGKHLDTEELISDLDAREWHDNSGWYNYGAEVYDDTVRRLERKQDEILRELRHPLAQAFLENPTAPKFLFYTCTIDSEYEDPEDDEWHSRTVSVSIFIV